MLHISRRICKFDEIFFPISYNMNVKTTFLICNFFFNISQSHFNKLIIRFCIRFFYCFVNTECSDVFSCKRVVAMMSLSRRATCMVSRSPTAWVLMFWLGLLAWIGTSTFMSSAGRKTTMVLGVMTVTVPV